MDDLRKCWKVPYIVYFCNLFEQKLDLIDLRVDEFEEAIIDDCGLERNIVVIHLIQKLLKPILNRSVDLTNYEQFLLTVLKRYQLEHLFLQDKEQNQWSELSMLTKLDIIYSLCEIRLQLSDTETKLTEFEANELRIEPLGTDSRGNKLWYFGDLRLYEEKPLTKQKILNLLELTTGVQLHSTTTTTTTTTKSRPNSRKKQTKNKKGDRTRKEAQKKKRKKKSESTDEEDDEEEEEEDDLEEEQVEEEEELEENEESNEPAESQQIDVEEDNQEEEEETNKRRTNSRKSLTNNDTKTHKNKPTQQQQATPTVPTRTTRRSVAHMPKEEADQLLKPVAPLPTRVSTRRSRRLTEQQPVAETTLESTTNDKVEETKIEEVKEEAIAQEEEEKPVEVKEEPEPVKQEDPVPPPVEDAVKQEENKEEQEPKKEDLEMSAYMQMMNEPREIKQPERLIEEKAEYKEELKHWSCVCLTLEEWQQVHDRYASSKRKVDQEIAKLIGENYLPEMPALFQKAEKERWQRLMAMAPKRQSLRLQSKQNETRQSDNSQQHLNESSNDSQSLNENSNASCQLNKSDIMARQREERLKQRLMRREFGDFTTSNDDASNSQHELNSSKENNDFNLKNYSLMGKVLNKLLQCKYAWPFKNAVSEEDAPDYNKIIQKPMDLSTVQNKVSNRTYKTRQEFLDDFELIVNNCLQYNGDDTYYGKLALKFQNFYKRWLQIFYPREISTSLEEKNRQLMSLMNGGTGVLFHDLTNDNLNETITQNTNSTNGAGGGVALNELNNLTNGGNENNTDLDMDLIKHNKKKRHHNPDKDKYIQEPQYVTKRTSSGRLVKMKISTDYDYTSDQELEAKKKKRDADDEVDECEGIQQKHRQPGADNVSVASSMSSRSSRSSSVSTNDDRSDDEDFIGSKSIANRKQTPGVSRRGRGTGQRGRPPRRTVKALTETINQVKFKAFNEYEDDSDSDLAGRVLRRSNQMSDHETSSDQDDSDSDNDLRALNLKKLNSSTNLFRRLTNISDSDSPPSLTVPTDASKTSQLTFEQYVKKLTGSYTLNNSASAPAPSNTSQSVANGISVSPSKASVSVLTTTTPRISLKITPAPSLSAKSNASPTTTTTPSSTTTTTTTTAKLPLNIPIINPAIKAVLTKFNQQTKPVNVNTSTSSNSPSSESNIQKTVKLITVPSSSTTTTTPAPTTQTTPSSKFIILNSSSSINSTSLNGTQESNTPSSTAIKVINLAHINNGINLKQITTPTIIKTTNGTNSNILSPILNKQIVMINNNANTNANKQIVVNTVPIQLNTLQASNNASTTSANVTTPPAATSQGDSVQSG